MKATRRGFLAALAAVPVVWKVFADAAPPSEDWTISGWFSNDDSGAGWHSLVVTSEAGVTTTYRDGSRLNRHLTHDEATALSAFKSRSPFAASWRPLLIAHVATWDRPLSPSEVKVLMP